MEAASRGVCLGAGGHAVAVEVDVTLPDEWFERFGNSYPGGCWQCERGHKTYRDLHEAKWDCPVCKAEAERDVALEKLKKIAEEAAA